MYESETSVDNASSSAVQRSPGSRSMRFNKFYIFSLVLTVISIGLIIFYELYLRSNMTNEQLMRYSIELVQDSQKTEKEKTLGLMHLLDRYIHYEQMRRIVLVFVCTFAGISIVAIGFNRTAHHVILDLVSIGQIFWVNLWLGMVLGILFICYHLRKKHSNEAIRRL